MIVHLLDPTEPDGSSLWSAVDRPIGNTGGEGELPPSAPTGRRPGRLRASLLNRNARHLYGVGREAADAWGAGVLLSPNATATAVLCAYAKGDLRGERGRVDGREARRCPSGRRAGRPSGGLSVGLSGEAHEAGEEADEAAGGVASGGPAWCTSVATASAAEKARRPCAWPPEHLHRCFEQMLDGE